MLLPCYVKTIIPSVRSHLCQDLETSPILIPASSGISGFLPEGTFDLNQIDVFLSKHHIISNKLSFISAYPPAKRDIFKIIWDILKCAWYNFELF
jgi:hypothetical protein